MNNLLTAAIIIIGNEILSGKTLDINTQFIASELTKLGINLSEVRIIKDNEQEIVNNVNELKTKYTYIFTTGGIGPTHDDITSESISKAVNLPYEINEQAKNELIKYYSSKEQELNDARLKMAYMPRGAKLIYNNLTGAPGFNIENIFVLPGIPRIMQEMFGELKQFLKTGIEIKTIINDVLLPESVIAKGFADLQKQYPQVEMGSYPYSQDGKWGSSLVLRSADYQALEESSIKLKEFIDSLMN